MGIQGPPEVAGVLPCVAFPFLHRIDLLTWPPSVERRHFLLNHNNSWGYSPSIRQLPSPGVITRGGSDICLLLERLLNSNGEADTNLRIDTSGWDVNFGALFH